MPVNEKELLITNENHLLSDRQKERKKEKEKEMECPHLWKGSTGIFVGGI